MSTTARARALTGAVTLLIGVVLASVPAQAAALPPAASSYQIQTNGPNGAIGLGDWYTATAPGGGAGHHYVTFVVPCGWPAGEPVHVDLFSPEMNAVSGAIGISEEPNGAYDSTQFELYGPGASVGPGYAQPAPGSGFTQVTFQPGAAGVPETWGRFATISAPVGCGPYVLRSEVLAADPLNPAGTGNDQNSWRIRVGRDDDADPTNAPPANIDDPDGVPGTNDEIALGANQVSFQHEGVGAVCQTYIQYVSPGQASVTFHNYDMDGNTRLRYYAPSDAYDPTAMTGGTAGTLSTNAAWNGGTTAVRGGDTIANPESGWWRLVACLSAQNQLVLEGQTGVPTYSTQPPAPALATTIDDGVATVSPGDTVTYTIDVTNVAAGLTAGAANAVVATVPMPAGVTYSACGVNDPADGTWACSEAGGVVTYTQTGWIDAVDAAELSLTVDVDTAAVGPITMPVTVTYADALGNAYSPVSANDVDTVVVPSANLSISITDSADPVAPGDPLGYSIVVTNAGPSDATGVDASATLPFTVTGVSTPTGTCSLAGASVSCSLPALSAGSTWTITVDAMVDASTAPGTYTATASVAGVETDPDLANNDDDEDTTVVEAVIDDGGDGTTGSADIVVDVAVDVPEVPESSVVRFDITVRNDGPEDATNVLVRDALPEGLELWTAVPDAGEYDEATGEWLVGDLPLGEERVLTLVVTTADGTAGSSLTNEAQVTGRDQPDPNPENDIDAAMVSILGTTEIVSAPDELAYTGAPVTGLAGLAVASGAAGILMLVMASTLRRRDERVDPSRLGFG